MRVENCKWCMGRGCTYTGPFKVVCMECKGVGKVDSSDPPDEEKDRAVFLQYILECEDWVNSEFQKELPDRTAIMLMWKAMGLARERISRL